MSGRGPSILAFAGGAAGAAGFVALAFGSAPVRALASLLATASPFLLFAAGLALLVRDRLRPPAKAPRRDAILFGLAIPAATFGFACVLLQTWSAARSNGSYTGGLLPVSDAGAYFAGAERLLQDGTLDGWNSRRPLNAALFATRLALAGGEFRGALFLQAALMATTTVLAARALARDYGRGAGVLFFAGLYVFGGVFVATTMSESLGLSLGALSFALLWHALRTKRPLHLAAGFAVCAMALNARSGPFFVLPSLIAWAALRPKRAGEKRLDRAGLAASVAGTAVGFGVNSAISRLYGGAAGGTHSNFSYTLYGLAIGGKGWERAIADYPELHAMGDAEAGNFVYARAIETIKAHPFDLVIGLARNVECFVFSMSEKLSGGLCDGHPVASWLYALVWGGALVALIVRTARVHGKDRGLSMVAAATLGVLASVPVIYMDGRERVFAAAVPFVIAGCAIALTSLGRGAAAVAPGGEDEHGRASRLTQAFAITVTLAAVVGPFAGHRALAPKASFATGATYCPAGTRATRVSGRSGLPRVELVGSSQPGTFAPRVEVSVYRPGIARDVNLGTNPYAKELGALGEGETLVSAYDVDAKRVRHFVVGSPNTLDVVTTVCADFGPEGNAAIVRVSP